MIRKIISIGIEFLLFVFIANPLITAASTLQWGPVTEDVTGYRIYYGDSQGNYSKSEDVGMATAYSISALPLTENATYYFVLRAYNANGESENSNEISWTVPDSTPPIVPAGLTYNEQNTTLQWMSNTENDFKEYRVYSGTVSRNYGPFLSVGQEVNYSTDSLEAGRTYYFAVTAVDESNNESGYSSEIQITVDLSASEGPRLAWVQEGDDISGYRIYYGISSGSYPSYKDVGLVTQYSFDNLSLEPGVTYYLIVRAYNAAGESDNSNEIIWTPTALPVVDTTEPLISITSPTGNAVYQINSISIDISGTASDNIGISQISWNNSRGGNGQASGTNNWVISNLSLSEGENIITITASDAAGNDGVAVLTVTYVPPDTISPTVTVNSPTTGSNFTTDQPSVALAGIASDNVGVTQVTWSSSRGGIGTATGTNNWSISNVALVEGENIITVQAIDDAGNQGGRILAVTYIPPDTTAPSIEIISPTNQGVYSTDSGTINLSGNASDNVGVTQVRWINSRGGSDVASGTENWMVQNVSLAEGDNEITITARDETGNEGGITITVNYTPPDINIPNDFMRTGIVTDVSNREWVTVNLLKSFQSMVVVCSPLYTNVSVPLVIRIQNASGSSFQVRADRADGKSGDVEGIDVHYCVVEEGVYTNEENGVKMEAVKINSTVTDSTSSWVGQRQNYFNTYSNPVVLGQVMTYNDSNFSVFWSRGNRKTNPALSSILYVGKHVGEDSNKIRNDETIGYIVFESGSGSIRNLNYIAAVGSDTIKGIAQGFFPYSISGLANPTSAIVCQAAMDGGDGGWAVLYGPDALSSNTLKIAIDEDQIKDTERSHTTEQVSYVVFQDNGK